MIKLKTPYNIDLQARHSGYSGKNIYIILMIGKNQTSTTIQN